MSYCKITMINKTNDTKWGFRTKRKIPANISIIACVIITEKN